MKVRYVMWIIPGYLITNNIYQVVVPGYQWPGCSVNDYYYVLCDDGTVCPFLKLWFVPLDEERMNKINVLGI